MGHLPACNVEPLNLAGSGLSNAAISYSHPGNNPGVNDIYCSHHNSPLLEPSSKSLAPSFAFTCGRKL